jgi:hypothetical protein
MKALSMALALAVVLQGAALAAPPGQKTFDSLDDAVNALVGAFRAGDRKALTEILGPRPSADLIRIVSRRFQRS